jgi:ABC-type uncharacterized transport system substrate-binding protein
MDRRRFLLTSFAGAQPPRRIAFLIVAFGNAAARAARRATSTTPVLLVGVADPVEDGLIESLAAAFTGREWRDLAPIRNN